MKKHFSIIIMAIIFASCGAEQTKVNIVSSSPTGVWQQNEKMISSSDFSSETAITINTQNEFQKVDGFGGCFNELGWVALQGLPEAQQKEILDALFDNDKGCQFNIFRMPLGANDYAVDWYSHNETVDDIDMSEFSIDRDMQRLVPYIKKAQSYNPNMKLWASPWCPPSWMKTNNHYACNPTGNNDLTEAGKGAEMQSQFRMEEKYLSAYALYFSKFIEAYKNEGIDIYAVHVQNEPNSCQDFPSCVWEPKDLGTFIGKYLGPQLKEDAPETEIWLGTIERPNIERVDETLVSSNALDFITGIGFQWAGKGAIPEVYRKYPDLKLMQTETECGDGSNDWAAAEHTFGLMKHYFNNGANTYLYWNMILNETGKSQWGWKQNSMISVDSKTHAISYNPEYYLMKHFSRFVKPGAIKVESSNDDCLTFKNENKLVIIYHNTQGKAENQAFTIDGKTYHIEVEAQSYNTIEINL